MDFLCNVFLPSRRIWSWNVIPLTTPTKLKSMSMCKFLTHQTWDIGIGGSRHAERLRKVGKESMNKNKRTIKRKQTQSLTQVNSFVFLVFLELFVFLFFLGFCCCSPKKSLWVSPDGRNHQKKQTKKTKLWEECLVLTQNSFFPMICWFSLVSKPKNPKTIELFFFFRYWLIASTQKKHKTTQGFLFLHFEPTEIKKKTGKTKKNIFWLKTKHYPQSVFCFFGFAQVSVFSVRFGDVERAWASTENECISLNMIWILQYEIQLGAKFWPSLSSSTAMNGKNST